MTIEKVDSVVSGKTVLAPQMLAYAPVPVSVSSCISRSGTDSPPHGAAHDLGVDASGAKSAYGSGCVVYAVAKPWSTKRLQGAVYGLVNALLNVCGRNGGRVRCSESGTTAACFTQGSVLRFWWMRGDGRPETARRGVRRMRTDRLERRERQCPPVLCPFPAA